MMFGLLLDVMDRACETPTLNARISHRTLRDGSFGMALSQALRARLRSHRPSGTFATGFSQMLFAKCLPARPVGYGMIGRS